MQINIHIYVLILYCLLLSSCLTPMKSNPPIKYYVSVEYPEEQGESTGLTVGVRGIEYPRTITQFVTMLDQQGKVIIDESKEWAEHPSEIVKKLLVRSLLASGKFEDVADVVEIRKPDLIIFSEIRSFYLIKEKQSDLFEVAVVIRLRDQKTSRLIWSKMFLSRAPIEQKEANFSWAVSQALTKISIEIVNEMKKIDFSTVNRGTE